jgi:hypothetical protein
MNRRPGIALLVSALLTLPAPVMAARCGPHPPTFVSAHVRGPITPYVVPYGGNYRTNSPGPVYCSLPDWHPHDRCRLWRYNYLYWTCG